MNLREMMDLYYEEDLTRELAAARACQDIILKAISEGPLNRNVTIKGGVVMRSLTHNNRRATRDIDLDFIHYSLDDGSIKLFVEKLNCLPDFSIVIEGEIEELKHEDYHGKRIKVAIADEQGTVVRSKIDIGVHKHLNLEQNEYCFDVCMDDEGASLLKNTVEQSFTEKLRSLLVFGPNSRRYKDVYDMYYLKGVADKRENFPLMQMWRSAKQISWICRLRTKALTVS
ncbi:MAG: nucleotidyl transferase AbiEii/AbiGii toxin family protein [Parasporobacterium sp.]|nr:nucleotidyl transferase AbiEii/AbiGii toxin family protein [Parasporobacterium sp.]